MANETARKWSLEEFYGLIRHNRTNATGSAERPVQLPIELIEGHIMPILISEQLERQVERLRQQLQQCLAQQNFQEFEVRSHYPIRINPYSELRPTLTVVSTQQSQETIHWVIEINKTDIKTGINQTGKHKGQNLRSRLYAHYGITEYWALSTEQVELRTHHTPESVSQEDDIAPYDVAPYDLAQYQHHQLQHVGEQTHPMAFPQLTMHIQEPLPLFFLTRTATGHRTYIETMLPLQVQQR